jgi:4-hydroxybenzoate polyprenyltransferase
MVGVVASVTTLSYMLWTIEGANIKKYGIQLLITFPFVVYGMFRYLYLVHKKNAGGDPTELIFRDFPLIVTISLWLVVILFIMHKGLIVLEIGNLFLR